MYSRRAELFSTCKANSRKKGFCGKHDKSGPTTDSNEVDEAPDSPDLDAAANNALFSSAPPPPGAVPIATNTDQPVAVVVDGITALVQESQLAVAPPAVE